MKKTKITLWIIILGMLFLAPLCFADGSVQDAPDGYIGIISAMDNEIALLLSNAEIERIETVGKVVFYIGTLCGRDVIITRSGIGKVLSASGTAAMLGRYPVSALIFTGIAGGVGDETSVLDVVVATELVQHDYGFQGQDGFEWTPAESSADGYYFCDEGLVKAAFKAAKKIVGKDHAFKGLIATGDQFVASETYVRLLQDRFGAMACEMEGASVAAVCEQHDVPYVVIRTMSDKADGKAVGTYENMGDIAADNSGRIVMNMLEQSDFPPVQQETLQETVDTAYADKLFDTSFVHRIDVTLTDGDWMDLLSDPVSKTKYQADISIDDEKIENVAFSTKGNYSLVFVATDSESTRYSFKVNFGKNVDGQTYYGLDKLHLNNLFCDTARMKDFICYQMFRRAGVNAPLTSYVWLTVNGEDQGLYLAVEAVDKAFLNRTYGGEGVIYSVETGEVRATLDDVNEIKENGITMSSEAHGADFLYTGDRLDGYTDIIDNAETSAGVRDHRRVISALKGLSRGTNLSLYLDTDEIIRYFAVHNFVLNYDSYTGEMLHNMELYEAGGRLSLLPWDYNSAFGTFIPGVGTEALRDAADLLNTGIDTPLIGTTETQRPMWKWIADSEEYLREYHDALDNLISDYIESGEFAKEIDRLYEQIQPYVDIDPTSFYSTDEFEAGTQTLKQFCLLRAESIRRQLAGTLSSDSEMQAAEAKVDASGLRLENMGIFTAGNEQ